ncbi:hypothetical protein BN7_2672 [Wickerhamomyces ciferrii]|uniref:Eukaryotic translation initiation factor 3 subunit D n=1 Tax=Wickerhamomyces ciferrii (strain ATCC 14091 / BCRC 22168 / CBS 111 / JCM 3599 / NBRC 0793 / NRRL Y-1031 F-60-10) TaxID=1206466 RepID=K0KDD8_WICCF|nr:uncharacterized protein BN7_2672 [Wickerhamomyces ciferrii]CCH43125.1 hypothetical protein BN7_2672 [Wickerhamomyces ciferrii]
MPSVPFDLKSLAPSANIWGPPAAVPNELRFSDIPYAPFSKGDKLGKAADWTANENLNKDSKLKNQRGQRDYFHAYGASAASSFAAETTGEEEFSVVDNSKTTAPRNQNSTTVLKGRRGGNNQQSQQQQGGYQKKTFNNRPQAGNNANQSGQRKPFFGGAGGRRNWKDDKPERVREPSVKIEDDWKLVEEVKLSKLTQLNFEVKDGEEIDSYGSVNLYNKKIERNAGVPLKVIDRAFYNPSASDDPVIQSLHSQNIAKVYTTDSVITQLMCASRSVYSWDIVATKSNGTIFLDKRDGSSIDKITVDENAIDAPSDSLDANINNAENLSLEATYINQNFLANSVLDENVIKLNKPNPFHIDSSEPLLSKGYKYKKFNLQSNAEDAEPLSIVVRTEFDSKDHTSNQTLAIKAVNEYTNTGLDWKSKFTSQRGAIIAAELKNNNNKFSKWTNQAILAGVDTIKLGFVSRSNFKDNTKHTILGVSSYRPQDLALQINLSTGNGWGIVKSFIDIISREDDGKFVILKDPNSPKLTVFKVPENAFQDEE